MQPGWKRGPQTPPCALGLPEPGHPPGPPQGPVLSCDERSAASACSGGPRSLSELATARPVPRAPRWGGGSPRGPPLPHPSSMGTSGGSLSFPVAHAPLFLQPPHAAGRSSVCPPLPPRSLLSIEVRTKGAKASPALGHHLKKDVPRGQREWREGPQAQPQPCPHAPQDLRSLRTRRNHEAGPAHPNPGAGRGLGEAVTGPPGSVGSTRALLSSPGCATTAESPSQQLLPAPRFPPDAVSCPQPRCPPPRCPILPIPDPLAACLLAV